jgi:hypothetical protein
MTKIRGGKTMEENQKTLVELKWELKELCRSKSEEFKLLGYEHVSIDEIWECVCSSYRKGIPPLHQIVNDILSLKVTKFMNWLTIRMYRGELD